MYRRDIDGRIVREDGAVIPYAPGNADFAAVLAWLAAGNTMPNDADDPAQQRKTQVAAIAAKRFAVETGGIVVQGMPIDTSRDSQNLITGAALAADRDSTYHVQWKTSQGFVDLNAEQMLALADAVRQHVQACFNREAELLAALDAGALNPGMLDEGWPA